MPVRTKDLDKAIAEVIGTFEGVEEIIALLRKERHWRSCRPARWKIPGGGYFRNFWVGMCRWDPGTLNLYQS